MWCKAENGAGVAHSQAFMFVSVAPALRCPPVWRQLRTAVLITRIYGMTLCLQEKFPSRHVCHLEMRGGVISSSLPKKSNLIWPTFCERESSSLRFLVLFVSCYKRRVCVEEDDGGRREEEEGGVYRDRLLERPRLVWMIDFACSVRL